MTELVRQRDALKTAIVWLLNALGAARLEREIDRIERVRGG